MNTVFVNPELCVGCRQCELACLVEHSQSKDLIGALTEQPLPRRFIVASPGLHLNSSFPSKCRHCNPAPCQQSCPTGATKRDETDIVLIEGNKCISCGMCAMVCPFDVITYYPTTKVKTGKSVAVKCDNCIERQKQGRQPACVEICKVGALQFGDINDLVKKARTKLGKSFSVIAEQIKPEEAQIIPPNIKAWHGWGEEIARVNEKE